MRISVSAGSALLRDSEFPDGSHSIHEFSAISLFNQIAFTTSNQGMRAINFFPNHTTVVRVAGSGFSLCQDSVEFVSGQATSLSFDIQPRTIVQLPALNRVASPDDNINVVIKFLGAPLFDETSIDGFYATLQRYSSKGYAILLNGRELPSIDHIEFGKRDGGVVMLHKKMKNFEEPVMRFLELVVKQPIEYEIKDWDLEGNVYFKVCQTFYARDSQDPKESDWISRVGFEFGRLAVFWNEAFVHYKDSLGDRAPELLDDLIRTLSQKMPIESFLIRSGSDTSEKMDIDQTPTEEAPPSNLFGDNFLTFLQTYPSKRQIEGVIKNIVGNYLNLGQTEANANGLLWTPIFDCCLLPDENDCLDCLYSNVEVPLKNIPGCIREPRVDYAVFGRSLYPLVLAEYAAGHLSKRQVHKDFIKQVIEAIIFLLWFIGLHRNNHELLKIICCFVMYVAGDEVEFGIVRPLFDAEMNLKGFSFTTNKNFRFRLEEAGDMNDEDADLDPEYFAGDIDPYRFFEMSDESVTEGMVQIYDLISILELGTVPPENRTKICPVSLTFDRINVKTLRAFRNFGIFLNRYARRMLALIDQADPADGPPPKPQALGHDLQNQVFLEAISNVTPTKEIPTTINPDVTPVIRRIPCFIELKELLKDAPLNYYYDYAAPVENPPGSLVMTSMSCSSTNHPQKALFFILSASSSEVYFRRFVAPKDEIFPLIADMIVFNELPESGDWFLGLENLESFERVMHEGLLWFSDIIPRLRGFFIDALLAIEGLARFGWAHGNICPDNIRFGPHSQSWKLASLGSIRPLGVTCEPSKPGTRGFVDSERGHTRSVQSELYSLGATVQYIIDDWAIPKMKAPRAAIAECFAERLGPYREFAMFLMNGPSIRDALRRAQGLGSLDDDRYQRLEDALGRFITSDPPLTKAPPSPPFTKAPSPAPEVQHLERERSPRM